jgi:DNA-binding SARP family transcriptional activator/tetratricopeptide (TPR) repeat protein
MIAALWNDRPPPSATNIIQTYVKHLRRICEPDRPARAPGTAIRAMGDGYAIDTSTVEVDLVRFRELAANAMRAQRRGDQEAAAELFGRSVAQWSGDPFADVPLLAAHPKAAALLAEKRAALIGYAESLIDLGAARNVLPLLEDAVHDQPLDETMVALLIRACQATGQRARAFRAYHETRRRLVDELGIEPGPELTAAHAVLLDEPSTATGNGVDAGTRQRGSGLVTPAQLPPANSAFAGRAAELRLLDSYLAAAPTATTIIAIEGPAGIGKTSLALRWAHRLTHRFSDGQLFVNLRGFGPTDDAMSTAEAVRRFLDALGVPPTRVPTSVESQLDLYRSLLAGRQVLVVLDNACDAEQVRPLLPGAPGCLAIVTSRMRLSSLVAVEGARPLTLGPMPRSEAGELLARHLGSARVAAEPGAVEHIVRRCGHLPLALAVTAARAATHPQFPLAAIAAELDRAQSRLDAFTGTDLRNAFAWSYRALPLDVAAFFRLLGLHPGADIAAPAAAALANLPVDRARPLLAALAGAHLITEHAPGRYQLHDLLRAYAAELADTHDTSAHRSDAVERLLDHYLHTGQAAAIRINPQLHPMVLPLEPATTEPEAIPDVQRAWAWIDAERPNLLAAVRLAATMGFDRHAWQLAWTLSNVLYRQGHWHAMYASQTAALDAARRLEHSAAQADTHRRLAAVLTQFGRFDESAAHLERALDLFTTLGDLAAQAHTHAGFNNLYGTQQRYAEALPHALIALDLYRSAGHLAGQAETLNAVAWNLAMLGHHERALEVGQHAMKLLVDSGDRASQAGAWDTIGYARHHLGDHADAVRNYRHAIELFREVGDLYAESHSWLHLGDTYHTVGEDAPARRAWRQALEILERLAHPDARQARTRLDT